MCFVRSNIAGIERFRMLIRRMTRDSLLYEMLKDELEKLGHWKQKPRGKPGDPRKLNKQSDFMA